MRRLLPILAVVVLAGCGGGDGGETTTTVIDPGPVNVGLAANVDGVADIAAEIKAVQRAGAHWLREDLEWDVVQPRRGTFDWRRFDTIVEEAAKRDIHVLPILDSSPCWAVPQGTVPEDCWRHLPMNDGDFAGFVAAVAARYGPGGKFWRANRKLDERYAIEVFEVWNEPYIPGGAEPVDPTRFAGLQRTAVSAGREANPRTRWLLAAALTTSAGGEETSWPQALADADPQLMDFADALSVHIYPSSESASRVDDSASRVRDAFDDAFDVQRPLWITELGLAACGAEATGEGRCVDGATRAEREQNKARLLGDAMHDLAADPTVQGVFVYTLREFDRPFYGDAGLFDVNGRELPALEAYREAAQALSNR